MTRGKKNPHYVPAIQACLNEIEKLSAEEWTPATADQIRQYCAYIRDLVQFEEEFQKLMRAER